MQLDRIPPRPFIPIPGTLEPSDGVPAATGSEAVAPADVVAPAVPAVTEQPVVARRRPRGLRWLLLALACATLVGQGERFDVDARFRSPGTALETYWRAVRSNDLQTVAECFTEPQASLPFPGMLWFLPPVDHLELRSVRMASATAGDVVVVYEVRFTPVGAADDQVFATSTELRRVGHEWRIVPPSGQAGMPEWKPYPRPVDI